MRILQQAPKRRFDDAEPRLRRLLAQTVKLLALRRLQAMRHHLDRRRVVRRRRCRGKAFGQRLMVRLPTHRDQRIDPRRRAGLHIGLAEIYPDSLRIRIFALANRGELDSSGAMIGRGLLDKASRQDLAELARDGSAAHCLARRANALVLLDDGMSCEAMAKLLLLDDDTIRTWHRLDEEAGIEGLTSLGYEGSACRLNGEQQARLKACISETLPRTTREVGAWIEKACGISYQGRSGLIALLHRLGMQHRKPKAVSRKLDPDRQAAFIKEYEDLVNHMDADETVLFAEAVHPTHAVGPVGCWAPKQSPIAIAQTSGRQRLDIHGAIDLESGNTRMLEVATVNAVSTSMLLMAIEAIYPGGSSLLSVARNVFRRAGSGRACRPTGRPWP